MILLSAIKYYVLSSTDQHVQLDIGDAQIENNSSKKLIGVTNDAKLSFEKYNGQFYEKARAMLKALATVHPFMNIDKKKAFFTVQFSYCHYFGCFIVKS